MKKLVVIALSIMCMLSAAACTTNTAETTNDNTAAQTEGNKAEWEQFLDDYEAWADKYVEFAKKQKANPTDLSLIGDIAKMSEEAIEWAEKSEELEKSLEGASAAELKEYTKRAAEIAKKLAGALN